MVPDQMTYFKGFCAIAIGDSHIAKGIPCQDAASFYEDAGKGIYIAAVSDGHGSERHFMSEHGSKYLVSIAIESLLALFEESACSKLAIPFSRSEILTAPQNSTSANNQRERKKISNQDTLIHNLISSIISKWNVAIENHWKANKPSREYMESRNVPEESIEDYANDIKLEFAYGCTLIVYGKTPDFWLAFQVGDGTCIAFDKNADTYHPIPGDERFMGSTTASICNEDAIESFRYCYGNSNEPVAVFLGSDGLDGVFGTIDEFSIPQLETFYCSLLKFFVKKGYDRTVKEIETALPILGRKGVVRDDISLAGVLDMTGINDLYPILVKRDLAKAENDLRTTEDRLSKLLTEQQSIESEAEKQKEILKSLESEILNFDLELEKLRQNREKTLIEKEEILNTIKLLTSELESPVKDEATQGPSVTSEQIVDLNTSTVNKSKAENSSVIFSWIKKTFS